MSPSAARARSWGIGAVVKAPIRLVLATWGIVFSPVLLKELQVASRRKRTYFLRALYLLLLVLGLLQVWWIGRMSAMDSSVAQTLQTQGQLGEQLSLAFGWMQLIAVILVAPMLTGSCISDEIENRTFETLLTTPLSIAQIIAGKLLSRLAVIVIMILLPAPLLLAMRTFGGFDVGMLVQIEMITVATALLAMVIGLLMSGWERQGWRAVAVSYMWLALVWLLLPAFVAAIPEGTIAFVRYFFHIDLSLLFPGAEFEHLAPAAMLITNPLAVLAQITVQSMVPLSGGGLSPGWTTSLIYTGFSVGLAVILIFLAAALIRRTARQHTGALRASMWSALVDRLHAAGAGSAPVGAGGGSDHDARAHHRPVWDNAVLWREMRWHLRRRKVLIIVALLAMLVGLVYYDYQLEILLNPEMNMPFIGLGIFAQLLLAVIVAPTTVTGEKKMQSWSVLLCAPVTPRRILWAKFFGAMKIATIPAIIVTLQLGYTALFARTTRAQALGPVLVGYLAIGIGFSALVASVGVIVSLYLKRSLSAMAVTFALAFAVWGVLPLLIVLMAEFSQSPGDEFESLLYTLGLTNPFYWMSVLMSALDNPGYYYGAGPLALGDTTFRGAQFIGIVTVAGAALMLVSSAILEMGHLFFARITGRVS